MPGLKNILLVTLFIINCLCVNSQNTVIQTSGMVTDVSSNEPLPYVNIFVVRTHNGIISNEQGKYSPGELNAEPDNSICFQHIGYEKKYIILKDLMKYPDIALKSNTFNISEITVFPEKFDPRNIIEKILENKNKNYKTITSKREVFVRQRSITDFKDFQIDPKKKTAEPIKKVAENINSMMNRKFVSYTDFIGNYYKTAYTGDTLKSKLEATDALRLNPDMNAFNIVADSITNLSFLAIDSNEYWKMKTGILGVELVDNRKTVPKDTVKKAKMNDTLGREPLVLLLKNIDLNLTFTDFTDKDIWDFLYEPKKYEFALEGGTIINDEYVYIISFKPDKKGLYQGRMYVTSDTYALLRADYEYAAGKTGKSIQLLGISYTENMFKASIYFEKAEGSYRLKQFSKQSDIHVSIDRPLDFIKKKNRKLFDKKLEEIRTNLNFEFTENDAFEFFVIDEKTISEEAYKKIKQPVYYNVNYTDSANSTSWSDFSKIVPIEL